MKTTPRAHTAALSLLLAAAALLATGCDRRDADAQTTTMPPAMSPALPSASDTGSGMGASGSASAPDVSSSAPRP